jgi:DMSO/TMAO reductase YedYZ molybdopterin-dependent catalytic subunit
MDNQPRAKLTRRELFRAGLISGGALFIGFEKVRGLERVAWPNPSFQQQKDSHQQKDSFAGGKSLGLIQFADERPVQMDTAFGEELDGRLYTDLSTMKGPDPVTPTAKFYVRTRASRLLPKAKSWQISVDGLAGRPSRLPIADLKRAAKPMGLHLMECAGNVRQARFGMISVENWAGVRLSEVLDNAKVKPQATRVLISGFDRYVAASATSVPGASWVFTPEELKDAGAFLATEMNGEPLTRDHGAPVRLVVPGWYGCTCIKWVDSISLLDDKAKATSQMQEYAARTLQKGMPQVARDYLPAVIDQAAMPIRVEKWLVNEKIRYRVIGITWGGTRPVKELEIRFNPEEDYVRVDNFSQVKNDPWTLWSHDWSPKAPGTYSIRLAVKDPLVQARKMDSGYYVRSVEITEV